jgi:hypothetical protein
MSRCGDPGADGDRAAEVAELHRRPHRDVGPITDGVDTIEDPELGVSECSVPRSHGADDDRDPRCSDDEEIA